jgi:hypothetical protein
MQVAGCDINRVCQGVADLHNLYANSDPAFRDDVNPDLALSYFNCETSFSIYSYGT